MIHLPPPLLHPGMSVYGCVCRQAPTGQRPSASQRWPQVNCYHLLHHLAGQVSARAQPCRTSVCTCTTVQHKCLHVHNHAGQVSARAQPCRTSVCTCTTMQHKCLHMHNHAGQVSAHAQLCSTSVCTCTTVQHKCLHMQVAQLGSYLHKLKLDIQCWHPCSLCGGRKQLLYTDHISTAVVRQLLAKQLRGWPQPEWQHSMAGTGGGLHNVAITRATR